MTPNIWLGPRTVVIVWFRAASPQGLHKERAHCKDLSTLSLWICVVSTHLSSEGKQGLETIADTGPTDIVFKLESSVECQISDYFISKHPKYYFNILRGWEMAVQVQAGGLLLVE